MPTLAISHREMHIIIDSLSMPVGVAKVDRSVADSLRERLKHQMCVPPPPPVHRPSIRSPWPTNDVSPTKRTNWSYQPEPEVSLPKTTGHRKIPTVAELLEGLI